MIEVEHHVRPNAVISASPSLNHFRLPNFGTDKKASWQFSDISQEMNNKLSLVTASLEVTVVNDYFWSTL